MKKTALITLQYIVEVEEPNEESGIQRISEIAENIQPPPVDGKGQFYCEEYDGIISYLDNSLVNCGKCNQCGSWVTYDGQKPRVAGLRDSVLLPRSNSLICEICCPPQERQFL